jgi:hypothetical protein
MRLTKLCIILALVLSGWHAALASALCARRADCHASAWAHAARKHGGAQNDSHEAQSHTDAAVDHSQAATHANAEHMNRHGHCGPPAESPREAAHAAPHDTERETARGGDEENISSESVAYLRAPDSPCGHCVGRETRQPARAESVAPVHERGLRAAPAASQPLVTVSPRAPRTRFAPTEHSPPRSRPTHLLNSVLLI